jgi:hypothetical protein
MLRDVVIHLHNEQPILADLVAESTAVDTCLICTNLRTMNGKTPVFVERGDSKFVFPLAHLRFVEVRPPAVEDDEAAEPPEVVAGQPGAGGNGKSGRNVKRAAPEDDGGTYSVSPLQRLAWVSGDGGTHPEEPAAESPEEPPEEPETYEGELLRRVHEV